MINDLPILDLNSPDFSTRGKEVRDARSQHWCAQTPFGLAVLRHRQAGQILRDKRFRQGSHDWPRKVALEGSFAEFWQRCIISLEGEGHKLQRRVAQAALANDFVLGLQPQFEATADDLLLQMAEEVEFVSAFSEPFAGRAIATLLGVDHKDAGDLAINASTLGLAMGVDAKEHKDKVNAATERLMTLAGDLLKAADPNSFVPRLATAAEEFGLDDRQALLDLIVISIFGGVDTTRAQLAFAVALFANRPEHWTRLRKEPEMVPSAIDEIIRMRPTTTWASREACETVEIDNVVIPAGTTIHVLVHATATDPQTGHSGEFDPFARRKVHFGFGGGAHHCLGQFVARTDMACALQVMLRHVSGFQLAGTPDYLPDSGNTSPRSLPVKLLWDR